MVLALPHLDSEAIFTAESSQYEELQQQYMDLLQIKNELEESCIKKDKLLRDVQQALAEEQAKREAAEKEKQLLEERCKQLQKRVELLEKCFKESMIQMKEQIKREREVLLKEQNKRIERLEAQMKNMTNNRKSAKNYPTLMEMADDSEEDIPQPSWWSKICELIEELCSLIVKFFSCG
nr:guanylate-binding protein 4-like [Vulpes vulpes]